MKHGTEQILHAEALKREAVAFAEWIQQNCYKSHKGWLFNYQGIGQNGITTDQLYSQYLTWRETHR